MPIVLSPLDIKLIDQHILETVELDEAVLPIEVSAVPGHTLRNKNSRYLEEMLWIKPLISISDVHFTHREGGLDYCECLMIK